MKLLLVLTLITFTDCSAAVSAAPSGSVPDFTLPTLTGEMFRLDAVRGKRPVLLVFFATWCPSCNKEVSRLNDIYDRYTSRGLALVAVDVQENRPWVMRWAEKKGARYPILLDQKGLTARDFGISSVPTNVLLGFDGGISFWHNVLPDLKALEALFAAT